MALSNISVNKAWYLFQDILYSSPRHLGGGPLINSFIGEYEDTEENKQKVNFVFGKGLKSDGGWESVFIHISDISDYQMKLWEEGKETIPNSSICRSLDNGITRLGFF